MLRDGMNFVTNTDFMLLMKIIWKPTARAGQQLSVALSFPLPVRNGRRLVWSVSRLFTSVTKTIRALFAGVSAMNLSAAKHLKRCTNGLKKPTSQDLFTLNATEHLTKKNFRMFKAKCTQSLGTAKNMHSQAETADLTSFANTLTLWVIPAVQPTNTQPFGTNILAFRAALFGTGLTKA